MTSIRTGVVIGLVVGLVASPFIASPAAAEEGQVKTLLLVGGAIHDWKHIGDVLEEVMKKSGQFDITRVEKDLDALLPNRIAPYDLIVFYWTVGEIKDAQLDGLLNHVAKGKGFVTLHSGADSFRGNKRYREFIGGYFRTHPPYRSFQVSMTKFAFEQHPITKGIKRYLTTDEQYVLEYGYTKDLTILANGLYEGKLMPVIWVKPWGKGRVFYYSQGHDARAVKQLMVQKIFLRGAQWAAGREVKE
jgi:uncharacterized protein